jgi:hypothetical protein
MVCSLESLGVYKCNIYSFKHQHMIHGDHLAWPLVVGALLGKRREEPSPRHLLSFRAPTVPARYDVGKAWNACKRSRAEQPSYLLINVFPMLKISTHQAPHIYKRPVQSPPVTWTDMK